MKDEIGAAATFIVRFLENSKNVNEKSLNKFREHLEVNMIEMYTDHWFPDNPSKGQGYRCIRVNETARVDTLLKQTADDCQINYNDLSIPPDMTIWVDPFEVYCRLGEHKGTYCTVAKIKNGNTENLSKIINIEQLKSRATELAKQASDDIMSGYRRKKQSYSTPPAPSNPPFYPSVAFGTNSPVNYYDPSTYMHPYSSQPQFYQEPYMQHSTNRRPATFGNMNTTNRNSYQQDNVNRNTFPPENINGSPSRHRVFPGTNQP